MARGVKPKDSRNPDCKICNCTPCEDSFECRRARGQDSYNARKSPASTAPSKSKSKSTKPKPSKSKKSFIKNLRKKNPTISDADIKSALKKAGYSTGCLGVAAILLSATTSGIYGLVELVSWVT